MGAASKPHLSKRSALALASHDASSANARLWAALSELEHGGEPLIREESFYASLIRQCRDSRALEEASRLHRHLASTGFDRGTLLGNLLVQMYGRCGSPELARRAFDRIASPDGFSRNILLSAYAQNGRLQDAESIFESVRHSGDVVSWNAMISAYAQNDRSSEAIHLFRSMDLEGVFPNVVSFVGLLDACAGVAGTSFTLANARSTHRCLEDCGHLSNVAVATALVNLYGRCGSFDEAKSVFNQMPAPNVVSWTTMMALFVQRAAGDAGDAKAFFDGMGERNLVSWNAMVAVFAQKGHLLQAKEVYDLMPGRDSISTNTMINAYAHSGQLQQARLLFDTMLERNVVAWNSIIVGYAQNGVSSEPLQCFRTMNLDGVPPNRITFLGLLEACVAGGLLDQGRKVHSLMVEVGYADVTSENALINMYSKCGDIDQAKRMFDGLATSDVVASTAMVAAYAKLGRVDDAKLIFDRLETQDVVAWTAMIAAYAQNGHVDQAADLFEQMKVRDVIAWNTMIVAYGQTRRVEEAKRTFDMMTRPSTVSWNAIIAAYAQSGHPRLALSLFPLMDLEGEAPNKVTFLLVLDACACNAGVAEASLVHQTLLQSGIDMDDELGTTVVNMFGRCGRVDSAVAAFNDMKCRSRVTWNAVVSAYAQNGRWQQAIVVARNMEVEGLSWNDVTFVSVLFACSHAGKLADGRGYFVSMRGDYCVEARMEHYLCMLDLLCRAGMMDDARDMLACMPFEPDPVAWKVMCGASRDAQSGVVVAAESFLQNDDQVKDSSLYVLVSNMYSS